MYKSSITYQGGSQEGDADIVYYNASIISNRTVDQQGVADPLIRFNETRDAPILKDASKYQFSIVRFVINGGNKDLPLFIPIVKTTQADPNVTEYECAISYQQTWATTEEPAGHTFTIAPPVTPVYYITETQNPKLAPVPRAPNIILPDGKPAGQDLTTRYYWVYTYQHWVDLVNTALLTAHQATYTAFQTAWAAATADAFPYATFADFQAVVKTPYMTYNETTGLFSIYGDSAGFGERTSAFTPTPTELSAPVFRLFFDSNMFGLFSGFNNTFYDSPVAPFNPTPIGYVNEILFPNKNYTNILDYVNTPPTYVPASSQAVYWVATQDYESTSTLWSPIENISFITTLLPLKNETTSAPVRFGNDNLGYSSSSISNAFEPILTDIALDLLTEPTGYRRMIYYAPVAEYRMVSFERSKQEVRNIDVAVYWKNRLTGELVPMSMYNQSSISIKIMFRRVRD